MKSASLEFLRRYVDTISPSGFEGESSRIWAEEASRIADKTWVDLHGNTFAVVNEGGDPRVMLDGHTDEIGLMITYIDENGYLAFTGIGGWNTRVLPGQRVRVQGKSGPLLGAIGDKPFHLLKEEEKKRAAQFEDLWIDIGAKCKEDAASLVDIGAPAVIDQSFAELRNGLVIGRGLDDKAGAFIVIEALRLLVPMSPKAAIYAVATVQEEIGRRGVQTSAFRIDPQVGIAVDVTHTTDTPGTASEKKKLGDVRMGEGPIINQGPNINPPLFRLLVQTAQENHIPYQIKGVPAGARNNANEIQLTRGGVVTGLLSIPNRYMHTPCEIVNLDDLENTAKLLANAVAKIDGVDEFIPW